MKYSFQVRAYKRVLKKPLVTSRCIIKERNGLIVRLENEAGNVGFGEIAPVDFLGSETFDDAASFCAKVGSKINEEFVASITKRLPCCRWGFYSAWEMMHGVTQVEREFEVAALISLTNLDALCNFRDYKTFKCKIGVLSFEEEKSALISLITELPQDAKLRLDANGALSLKDAKKWLEFLGSYNVQFLEQPLAKGQESLMVKLSQEYQTPLALDESIVGIEDLQKILENGWSGWLVVKPSLIHDSDLFQGLRKSYSNQIVYSSVFETAIGIEAGLALAASDDKSSYALGFGTIDYFTEDNFGFHQSGPFISSGKMGIADFERIWSSCK